MLYLVAIIEKPTTKGAEEGQQEKLVMEPTPVIAANEQQAIVAALEQRGKIDADKSRIQVLVRPF